MRFGISPQADGSNEIGFSHSRLHSEILKVVGRDQLVACIRSLVAPEAIAGLQVRVSVFRNPSLHSLPWCDEF